jgi:hypothetical protein
MQKEDQEDHRGRTGNALLPEVPEVAVSTEDSALSEDRIRDPEIGGSGDRSTLSQVSPDGLIFPT